MRGHNVLKYELGLQLQWHSLRKPSYLIPKQVKAAKQESEAGKRACNEQRRKGRKERKKEGGPSKEAF